MPTFTVDIQGRRTQVRATDHADALAFLARTEGFTVMHARPTVGPFRQSLKFLITIDGKWCLADVRRNP